MSLLGFCLIDLVFKPWSQIRHNHCNTYEFSTKTLQRQIITRKSWKNRCEQVHVGLAVRARRPICKRLSALGGSMTR